MTAKQSQVARVMARDVVSVSGSDSVRDALDLMAENHVSGLPVVAADDRCVGVISVSDILTIEQEHQATDDEALGSYFDPDNQRWEHVRIMKDDETLADITVAEVMSRDLTSVKPDTPINDVAQLMMNLEIHRVLVIGDDGVLHGIISAFDFVRLWATECPTIKVV